MLGTQYQFELRDTDERRKAWMTQSSTVERSPVSPCAELPQKPRLTVGFMPFNYENLYWRQLAKHLQRLGVEVTEWGMLKELRACRLKGLPTPDVIHLHWMPRFEWTWAGIRRLPSFWLHMVLLRYSGQKFIWTAHDLYHPEVRWRWADRWLTRLVIPTLSRVIVHTKTARDLVLREFNVREAARVVEIPHGNYVGCYPETVAAASARERLKIPAEATVFVLLGHLRRYKGIPELITAFQELNAKSAYLVIAGKSWDPEFLAGVRRLIKKDARVLLREGFVPDDEVQLYMNASDVAVFPYRQILTSGAVVLAMSFGKPCIATSLGCIPDLLDERGGFLYDPCEPDGLRRALAAAMESSARLKGMGAWNLERARTWSWESVAVATAAVYNAAVAE